VARSKKSKTVAVEERPAAPPAQGHSPPGLRIADKPGHRQAWKRHSGNKTFFILTFVTLVEETYFISVEKANWLLALSS
jgi:hypothetical protein